MKNPAFIGLLVLLFSGCSDPQATPADLPAGAIRVGGAVAQELVLNAEALPEFEVRQIGDIDLKKGGGEVYKSLNNAEGVLLKDILQAASPAGLTNKSYSSFFVVCTAADGYRTLYSWNELFNTEVGEQVYIITAAAGERLEGIKDGAMMVSLGDLLNGKRNLRGLSAIDILHFGEIVQ